MQVAASLSRPDVSFEEIEEIIGSDPGLSMRLLRLLNSAAYPLRARVATVHQALTLLGPAAVRQWGML
ncbi:MAG: HDOD domain-containing protein, partial [Solirubrobacterales bacterium]|nr:HDOD domain-containing protein [Solirubrobacterales bacterium]